MAGKRGMTFGVGINDVDYTTCSTRHYKDPEGNTVVIKTKCPFYARWHNMLRRCYKENRATCCEDWKYFSNFKAWMETQDWEGKHLDKDLLGKNLNHYSPDTCAFVNRETNVFLTDNSSNRGDWPLGVHWRKDKGNFKAAINIRGKVTPLGTFTDPMEAHLTWKKKKHELALRLAETEVDPRVVEALKTRYDENSVWHHEKQTSPVEYEED